ncbi:MAG: lipopolysaccharide kinase InaA family protein [Sulfuricurvum sp.]
MYYEAQAGYESLVKRTKELFLQSGSSLHKARNELRTFDAKEMEIVIKSFKKPNLLNAFIYSFFKDSKAKKSYQNAIRIANFTPRAIGYVEYKSFALLQDSYYVSERFLYSFTIREPLLDKSFANREEIFRAYALFMSRLHAEGILHEDLSPGNILISENCCKFVFKIVDINRMSFYTPTLEDRLKNFAKLWADDDDLMFIVGEYARLLGGDEKIYCSKALEFSQEHKDRKNFKKALKGKKIAS